MSSISHTCTVFAISLAVFLCVTFPGYSLIGQQTLATSEKNMVATVHPLATQAGLQAFEQGGNAVDAAVAAALMLGVVDGYNSGIGGGCLMVIQTEDGNVYAIDGREMAPAAAQRDMFIRDGRVDVSLSQTGPLAVAVPGALAAYHQVVAEHGRLEFRELLLPAADIAENGFEIGELYARRIAETANELRQFDAAAAILLRADGRPRRATDQLIQTELANTYRQIADKGLDYFYRGEFAATVSRWMRDNGGIIDEHDFANYKTVIRAPIRSKYRDLEIVGFPPPSSGGVHVAQILNMLNHFDLATIYETDPATFYHLLAEAMKLGFADRAHWLGDADFVDVPTGLTDEAYARQLVEKINLAQASKVHSHGTPPDADSRFFQKHTTHISAADDRGNFVAITTTVNTTFGSKVIVPGTGVILNNQMDDFAIAPGTPNAFGLIGNDANSIAPGKRPLSSMSPTLVLKDGQPIMAVGAAGGPRIITQVIHAIVHYFDLNQEIDQAIAAPRIHQQWVPDRLYLENSLGQAIQLELQRLGHETVATPVAGITQAVVFDREKKLFKGAADPRARGTAGGQ
ncbi:MAG TPA: gamma-glutamyltransferase [Pirellulaceae bacterium]|nr:gamma-glutamyltransferase [Pirellulaceae bacterium]HMO93117.1 gamma-glutamyltransferase [Pirellulaceae bacterium]HMP70324.1 gamma-glutamyltransferase [Pirellulaceae bacterium]